MATIEKYEIFGGITRYRVRYRTPDRRQTDRRGFKTKRDAEAWANQLEVDKRRGAFVAAAAVRIQLGVYAQEWLNTAIAHHAGMPLGDMTRQFVREWVTQLGTEMAPATVHKTGRGPTPGARHGGRREPLGHEPG